MQLLEEESDDEAGLEARKNLDFLDELVGDPTEQDTISFALPMCGPVSALQRFKYKGKLLPGGSKKGQAVQLLHRAFVEMTPAQSVERQLIKNLSQDELSIALVANPVVQLAAAIKIKKQDKASNKEIKKLLGPKERGGTKTTAKK